MQYVHEQIRKIISSVYLFGSMFFCCFFLQYAEFSSILEERACSNDVDSNKLSDEFDRPSKHLSIETVRH